MIVLNEHEWAENMINSCLLGKKPFETLCRVARYYIDNNLPKAEVRKKLDAFIMRCEPLISLPKWADAMDAALARALKYEAVNIECIKITKPEMEKIALLPSLQLRRLAFTLLCLAKYWDIITRSENHWVNSADEDIMKLANIKTSVKRQCSLYHRLSELGFIQFSKKVDNTNVRVCFMEGGKTAASITDFRNLGYQYLKYIGEPYFECENCGITSKYDKPNNLKSMAKQKYCKACTRDIYIQQTIDSVMRCRRMNNPLPC